MAEHAATVQWERGMQVFTDNCYSRAHAWTFDGGLTVPASSSPHVVPLPYSDTGAVDPEEAFVVSISSCHMLWFLSAAAKHGFCVDSYTDNPVGVLEKDDAGRLAFTRVTLRPSIVFSGDHVPDRAEIESLHHGAHEQCFIVNSVKTKITWEIV